MTLAHGPEPGRFAVVDRPGVSPRVTGREFLPGRFSPVGFGRYRGTIPDSTDSLESSESVPTVRRSTDRPGRSVSAVFHCEEQMTKRTSVAGWVVSEGTLRSQDLLPAFLRALEAVDRDAYWQVAHNSGHSYIPAHALEDDGAEWWDSEECVWILSDVADAIARACPEGLVFGPHEGDGACFGFWEVDA